MILLLILTSFNQYVSQCYGQGSVMVTHDSHQNSGEML